MEQPSDQDAQDQQFLDQQDIPPDEPQALNGEAEHNAPGLDAQGHGAVGLALSPPRPPPVDDGPFTQADKITMARLQQGLSQAQSDQYSGKITDKLGYSLRQRISAQLQPLMQKQKRSQQQQQQEAQQAAMGQAALQEGIQNVHLQKRAQGFAGTVATHIDPTTGRLTQLMPKMGAHGVSHFEPINQDDVDPEVGRGVESEQVLRQRAMQQNPPPRGIPQYLPGPRGPRANPAWLQWQAGINKTVLQWHGEQARQQMLHDRAAMAKNASQQPMQFPDTMGPFKHGGGGIYTHQDHPGSFWQADQHGMLKPVDVTKNEAAKAKADQQAQKAEQQAQKDAETAKYADHIEAEYGKAKTHLMDHMSTDETEGTGQNMRATGRKIAPDEAKLGAEMHRLHPRLAEQYEKVQKWRDKRHAKQFGEEDPTGGEMGKAHEGVGGQAPAPAKPDENKAAIDKGLGD